MVVGVVYSIEEAIFDIGDSAGVGLEFFGGGHDGIDGPAAVHGDDARAGGVVGGVEGEGEIDGDGGVGELVDSGDDADGGDGDVTPAEISKHGVGDALDGGEDVLEIVKGFAHSHEDEGAESPAEGNGAARRWRNCSTISPAERLRTRPPRALAQKSQPMAQPTWEEMQAAARSGRKEGMRTDSTFWESSISMRSFSVPSELVWWWAILVWKKRRWLGKRFWVALPRLARVDSGLPAES